MTDQEKTNLQIVRTYVDKILNEKDLEKAIVVANDLIHPEFIDHTPFLGLPKNKPGHLASIRLIKELLENAHTTLQKSLPDGDDVIDIYTMEGTFKRSFLFFSVNKRLHIEGADMITIANNKVRAITHYEDLLGFLAQGFHASPILFPLALITSWLKLKFSAKS